MKAAIIGLGCQFGQSGHVFNEIEPDFAIVGDADPGCVSHKAPQIDLIRVARRQVRGAELAPIHRRNDSALMREAA